MSAFPSRDAFAIHRDQLTWGEGSAFACLVAEGQISIAARVVADRVRYVPAAALAEVAHGQPPVRGGEMLVRHAHHETDHVLRTVHEATLSGGLKDAVGVPRQGQGPSVNELSICHGADGDRGRLVFAGKPWKVGVFKVSRGLVVDLWDDGRDWFWCWHRLWCRGGWSWRRWISASGEPKQK